MGKQCFSYCVLMLSKLVTNHYSGNIVTVM